MRALILLPVALLMACVPPEPEARAPEKPNVALAYFAYRIALNNAVAYAKRPDAMKNTVQAMVDYDARPEVDAATTQAEVWVMCKLNEKQPHTIPDYDCDPAKLTDEAMRPVEKELLQTAFVLRQGTFAIKDMHGQDARIVPGQDVELKGAPHDH